MFGVLAGVDGKVIWTVVWVVLRMATCSLNFLLGGPLHEPFCARVWRCWANGYFPARLWATMHRLIDNFFFFDPDHCYGQHVKTVQRKITNKWSIAWLWQTF